MPRLFHPVSADRCRRQHQAGTKGGTTDHQRQGLQGFTQPHVVSQTGPGTPLGKPVKPLKAGHLVVPQVCLQCRGHLRVQVLSLLQPLLQRLPGLVGGDAHAFHGLIQALHTQAMDLAVLT